MKKLFAGIKKELVLLGRDRAGLALLFLMPAILVVVITMVQNSTFQLMKDNLIPVVIVDKDNSATSKNLISEIEKIKEFNISVKSTLSEENLNKGVQKGTYKVGVFVPKGFGDFTDKTSNVTAQQIIASINDKSYGEISSSDTVRIQLIFDPVMKLSFRTAIKEGMENIITGMATKQMISTLYAELTDREIPDKIYKLLSQKPHYFEEKIKDNDGQTVIPSSTLHNVPAWSVFAMFFIVMGLGTNILYEKQQGSFMRLRTLPVSFMNVLLAKVITYIMVCFAQIGVILAIAFYVFPSIGLPTMEWPPSMISFIIITFLIALAATSYGMLVGTLATTIAQASAFGPISVMVLAAIGGVWVPTFAMPEFLQKLSIISPLNWGLESYYGIFIRHSTILDLGTYVLLFIMFSICCFSFTFASLKKQGII